MKKSILTLLLLFFVLFCFAQTGTLKGKITDKKTGELLPFVNISLMQNGKPVGGTSSNINGIYSLKNLDEGVYDLRFSYIYTKYYVKNISICNNEVSIIDVKIIKSKMKLPSCNFGNNNRIDIYKMSSGQVWTREQIQNFTW